MTVAEALRAAAARLAQTSDSARFDAELLMAHALGIGRSELLLRRGGDPMPETFGAMVERRAGYEPVAYIVGTQPFGGREFVVTRDVLIPRGDSEATVAAALAACPHGGRVLDCGTGSGALLVTILADRPDASGIGIDRSDAAIAVAADNARRLGVSDRARFAVADWHEEDWAGAFGRFDVVVANPPYVEQDARLDPDVRDWEPAGALFAGADGLDDYRTLVPQLAALLTAGGTAVLEIGASQGPAVSGIAAQAGFGATLGRDLAGRPRVLTLRTALN